MYTIRLVLHFSVLCTANAYCIWHSLCVFVCVHHRPKRPLSDSDTDEFESPRKKVGRYVGPCNGKLYIIMLFASANTIQHVSECACNHTDLHHCPDRLYPRTHAPERTPSTYITLRHVAGVPKTSAII